MEPYGGVGVVLILISMLIAAVKSNPSKFQMGVVIAAMLIGSGILAASI